MKIQYGPPAAKLTLRWRDGLFLPESSGGASNLEKLAEDAKADAAFLDLLDRFAAQGRNVSHVPNSPNFAPTAFAKEDCGFNRKQLDGAMRRLFAAGRIKVENYGKASNQHQRLARVGPSYSPSYSGPTPSYSGSPNVSTYSLPLYREGSKTDPPELDRELDRTPPVRPSTEAETGTDEGVAKRPRIDGLELIGIEPAGTVCVHCQQADGGVYLIRDPRRSVRSSPLHERCARQFYRRDP